MLESIPISILVGSLLGFLAGLGIGGGSLLVLWLTLVLNLEYTAARSINLLFFIPSALVACIFRWKQGVICLKTVLPAILSGCITAALASFWGLGMDLNILKKLFGGLLLITGVRELKYKPQK